MSTFPLKRFIGLLRRELQEHPNLFVTVPAGFALLLLLGAALAVRLGGNRITDFLAMAASLASGTEAGDLASLMMWPALLFLILLGLCGILYLGGSLYHDRKDMSVLFWQSMPVSNLMTVLSKIVTLALVAPLCYMLIVLGLYLTGLAVFAFSDLSQTVEPAGLARLLGAALVSLWLTYLSAILAMLWMFPAIGWILLFSAFATRTPLLWALGVFLFVSLMEGLVFKTQFLANWGESRAAPWKFIVSSTGEFPAHLFTYEMFIGVALGSVLVAGAVLMRRFVD